MYKQDVFPRWRGFNLLGMFCSEKSAFHTKERSPGYFEEDDFKMIADWGFDFVRVPLSYRVWSSVDNPYEICEEKIAPLDEAVHFGKKYGIHVNVCMHRVPGFCVNRDEEIPEKNYFWFDDEALDATVYQWGEIAKRYKDISSKDLSFNVVNEPGIDVCIRDYRKCNDKVINEVRRISPDRLFILDPLQNTNPPIDAMRNYENCGYSMHFYEPAAVTHYGVAGRDELVPWPNDQKLDRYGIRNVCNKKEIEDVVSMWAAISHCLGVGVHCGEFGTIVNTPHEFACAWTEDLLDVLKKYNIGFALWNLRGAFGILDSGRRDAEMKDYCGHKLDEKLLKILQKY